MYEIYVEVYSCELLQRSKLQILTLGSNALPNALAPANTCVNLCSLHSLSMRGVNDSAVNPLNASLSARRTLEIPLALHALCATASHFVPATNTVTSPPIFLAAVNVLQVIGSKFSLLCSAMTKVDS